jgi:signal transduction histidine kinase
MKLGRKTATFQPSARLVSILGEQMISDSVVGLIELVKNGYDADASQVTVMLDGLSALATTTITVEDDGFGMSIFDVTERFLTPGVDHKARAKTRSERTPKFGRLPIGEKGVGRFAIQQLGRHLELVTRAGGQAEVVVLLDWDLFDNPDARLSDITFEVVEREPEVFTDKRTGTRLLISVARDLWDRAKVEKLQKGLRRLRSPHVDEGKQGFDIRLVCPEYLDLQSLHQSDLRENYHYRFMALVDETGKLAYEYKARHPALPEREETSSNEIDLVPDARAELSSSVPACGPFYLNLYVWDRTAAHLKASGVSRAELDAVAGVSLFRDKLRVLPYGEPGDDWLFLDRSRINNPSERIGNNQVLGYVEIDQGSSGALRDKTNREGLIDNAAFRDLRALIVAAIRFFETHWRDDRPINPSPTTKPEPLPVTTSLKRARTLTSAIGQSASSEIRVAVCVTDASQIGLDEKPSRSLSQREAANEAINEIDQALVAQKLIETRQQEERELLLHLAATGQAAERLIHEVGRQSVAALRAVGELRGIGLSAGALSVLDSALGTLQNEFRLLSPEGGITRFQKRRVSSLREAASTAIRLSQHLLDERELAVEISGDDFTVYARPSSVVQVLDNLIHNAISWANARITVDLDATERLVRVRDDGPGVKVLRPSAIFEPHVTTKVNGQGLGLYIVRELLSNDGGKIELEQSEIGACFVLDFSGYPTKPVREGKE